MVAVRVVVVVTVVVLMVMKSNQCVHLSVTGWPGCAVGVTGGRWQ